MALKRTCPECGEDLFYANLAGYQRATRTRALCRRCAASPGVIQRRLMEAEQQAAAEKPIGSFMGAFFQKIEASLSKSLER